MKGPTEHSITERLRRWLHGDARAGDERQLDELAAGDEFLRDALEGLRRRPEVDHAAATERLRRRLRARTRRRGGIVVWLPRLAAAASVLLLLGLAWWRWGPDGASEEPALTQASKREAIPEITAPVPDTPLAALTERAAPEMTVPAPGGKIRSADKKTIPAPSPAISQEEESAAEPPRIAGAPAPPPPPDQPAPPQRQAKSIASLADSVSSRSLPAPAPPVALRREGSQRLLHGQILNPQGEPLIAANVLLKGYTGGAVTDPEGRFVITLPAGQQVLQVSYPGFAARELAVAGGDDSLRIVLTESSGALSESVVSGLSPAAGIAKEPAPAAPAPQPVGGFPELERYLRKNLIYPEAARQQRVQGSVRLEFQVRPDGALSDFRVLDSLGYGCDAEAIRLLREGPKWLTPAGRPATAIYEVVFELPKR